MAFQTGSQVRPELGRADLSGFARAGESIGAALASVGKSVGEGIEKYQTNKDVTLAGLASLEGQVAAEPTLLPALKNAGGDVGKAYTKIESGNYNQRDVLTVNGFATAYTQQKQATQASQIRDLQLQAAKSEKKSRDAAGMALSASREAGTGNINTEDAVSAYISEGGRDPNFLKIIESMQEVKGPNLKAIQVGPFTVLTQDGAFKQGFRDGEEATPSQQRLIEFKLEERKRARELYQGGNTQEANDILAVNGYEDAFGRPQTAEQAFGPLKKDPNDPSDDSSSLDDIVLGDEPPTNNVATAEEIQDFNNQFLTTNPQ